MYVKALEIFLLSIFFISHDIKASQRWSFTLRIVHANGDFIIDNEGLQNFGPCSALGVFEQEWIFNTVPNPVSSKGPFI
jgi:hypothetical protein